MRQGNIRRFLELLMRELDAVDARAELGGRDPEDARLLWTSSSSGFRLVVVFDETPADREQKQRRLEQLAQGFANTLSDESLLPPAPNPAADTAFRRLDAALEALRARSGGIGVVVVDVQSPVLWGSAEPVRHLHDALVMSEIGQALDATLAAGVDLDAICALQIEDVPARLRELGIDTSSAASIGLALVQRDETATRHDLLTCLAVARARREAEPSGNARLVQHETQFGYFARGFMNIYLLVVVFEGAFSELYVESAVVHALPSIAQLLMALPPLDPDPVAKRGRVIRLRK